MPVVKCAANSTITALITKEKRPNVSIVIGRENNDRIGLTIRFNKPKTIAKITAEVKSATCTPFRILDNKKATRAVIRSLIMVFIIFCIFILQFRYNFLKKQIFATLLVVVQFSAFGIIIYRTKLEATFNFGNALVFLSVAIGFWALYSMSKSKFTISPIPRNKAELVNNGPYGFIRHPMYLAVLMLCLGYVIQKTDFINILTYTILSLNLLIKLHWEEKLLTEKFENYRFYQQKTKKIIPFIF